LNWIQLSFRDLVYQINKNEPSKAFAKKYIEQGVTFFEKIEIIGDKDLANA
jgi:sulfite reductase (ferredoxin)